MISLKTKFLLAAMCLTLGAATALQAQERMRAGLWENTVTADTGQTATHSACLKPAQVAKSNGSPAAARAETEKGMSKTGCTLQDFKLDTNTLNVTMVCGSTTILQETKFHGGDSFETTMTNKTGGVTKVAHFKGRRTGDCKADAE